MIKMDTKYQMWRNKYTNHCLAVLSKNADGSVNTIFDLDTLHPRNIHRFEDWYLQEHYVQAGEYSWTSKN